jgi:hypothetical protein
MSSVGQVATKHLTHVACARTPLTARGTGKGEEGFDCGAVDHLMNGSALTCACTRMRCGGGAAGVAGGRHTHRHCARLQQDNFMRSPANAALACGGASALRRAQVVLAEGGTHVVAAYINFNM